MATAVKPNVLSAEERRRAANAEAIEAVFDLKPAHAARLLQALTSGEVTLPSWPVGFSPSYGRHDQFRAWLDEGRLLWSWKDHLVDHLRPEVSYLQWTAKHVLVYGVYADTEKTD